MKNILTLFVVGLIASTGMAFAAQGPTIAELVVGATEEPEPEFTILLQALGSNPELLERLSRHGKVTVFAPTDAAFVDLLSELEITAEELLANTELVATVLEYHVVPGNRDSGEVLASDKLRTLNKGFLFVNSEDVTLTDQNERVVNIIDTDLLASNGVIHVIDRVLLP